MSSPSQVGLAAYSVEITNELVSIGSKGPLLRRHAGVARGQKLRASTQPPQQTPRDRHPPILSARDSAVPSSVEYFLGWCEFCGNSRKISEGTFEPKLSHRGQTTVHTKHDRLRYAHSDILPFARIRSTMPNDARFPIKNATYRVITQSPDATNFIWGVMSLFIERPLLIPRADPLCRNAGEAATADPTLPYSELLRTKSANDGVTILF